MTKDGGVLLSDFGLSERRTGGAQSQADFACPGGTFGYQAPELKLAHIANSTAAADIWALGRQLALLALESGQPSQIFCATISAADRSLQLLQHWLIAVTGKHLSGCAYRIDTGCQSTQA